ncbi:Mur ligase domain-containing protein, partial [Streptomyces smyrnaeus]|uniref:Mur ligase domain-containing protein n=1 Tax=Streptomyces smyrnaeus TaxID=1387713 RepID=UPI0036CEC7DA
MTAAATPSLPSAMERPHFVGIGGAGMSGIAKILAVRGARVAGSDARESATADALRGFGGGGGAAHTPPPPPPRAPPRAGVAARPPPPPPPR